MHAKSTSQPSGHPAMLERQSVREALRLCDGVNEVHVQLEPGLATVTGGKMDPVELIEAVGSLRYKAVETTKEKTDDEG